SRARTACQRRSVFRSGTTAARVTLENLARPRAAIYPVLTAKLGERRRIFESDLHRGPLHAEPGDLPGAARPAPRSAARGCAPLPGVAALSLLRAAAACRRSRGGGDRLPARRGPGRAPLRPSGFAEHCVAERRIPRLRGSYGDAGLRARLGTPHHGRVAADRVPVRRSRAVALPPPAHRRPVDPAP